ncbi:MAG: hypothetical protein AABY32_00515 [Nanoarchaeota archaeon]
MANKKRIKKGIESLGKRKEEHEEKIKNYSGKDDVLIDYWKGEIERFEKRIKERTEKLNKK